MDEYIKILNIAIPVFIVLIGIEWIVAYYRGKQYLRSIDVVSSLSSGLSNTIRDVLGLTLIIISYSWLVDHVALMHIKSSIWTYIIVFVLMDFAQYWTHRWEHAINIFWNRHIVHHSSEDYNLACALRQPISNTVNIFILLYLPMALLGVPATLVAIMAPIHLFAQFWYHTRLIGKLGFLEHIIVTPSTHRVHHAINDIYLDKNFSAIFIIWDKLFGTYQAELDDVTPVYGVKRPVRTWNPIIINYQHLFLLIRDAWYTRSWKDKLRIWFMPTGFRPKDMEERFPIFTISDVYHYRKYETFQNNTMRIYAWIHLFMNLFLMLYLFNMMNVYNIYYVMIYGVFLFASIFSFTSFLDGSKWALAGELVKWVVIIIVISGLSGWYGIDQYSNLLTPLFICFEALNLLFIVSVLFFKSRWTTLSID